MHMQSFDNLIAVGQVIDLATSLAKVADVDRNLGNERTAVEGFKEAIECLEKLKLGSEQASLEQKVTITYPPLYVLSSLRLSMCCELSLILYFAAPICFRFPTQSIGR